MKAKLVFALPEDAEAYAAATEGPRWRAVVRDVDEYLRSAIKHQDYSDEHRALLEETRQRLHEACEDNDVSLV